MKTKQRILVIGGVAGGATFAARARRLSEDAEIIIFERGEYISFANCGLPYHIGGTIPHREQLLLQTPKSFFSRYRVDVRVNSEVINIDRNKKTITVNDLKNNREYQENYDLLLLSPGANPIVPPIPGIDSANVFTLRNMADMDRIINWINVNKANSAAIIGGGYIGLEMVEALHARQLQVSLIELAPQVMGTIDAEMASPLHKELSLHGVALHLGVSASEFNRTNKQLQIKLSNDAIINTDLAILAVGVKPDNSLAKNAGLEIGTTGGIKVNEGMQTSDPNIYAVGDAIEVENFAIASPAVIALAGPANRQARIAADNIFGRKNNYRGTLGTGICKVFNLTVGMTGVNERTLKKINRKYEKIYLHANDHAGYYPGATLISLKIIYDPLDGTILGAQAVGGNGIDKRIDIIATAIRAKQTIYDLQHLELCYAPPYGSAKDILNHAGFVAANIASGDAKICHVENLNNKETFLLDVRTPDEYQCGSIPGALNIPLDLLRERLSELPRDREIIAYCKVGMRGYLATRILMQNGFDCANLSGGYTTYLAATSNFVDNRSPQKFCATYTNSNTKNITGEITMQTIDARGLQCPGPIQQLKSAIDKLQPHESITILTSDRGFLEDAPAWCIATGNELISSEMKDGYQQTIICKKNSGAATQTTTGGKNITIVVFSGDLDKALAAFIIANGAAAMGYQVTLFFTFWGLNILRRDVAPKVKKNIVEKMFGIMMPRGAKKLALSKMNFCGLGTEMIKNIMRKKNVSSLSELIASAQQCNVRLIACNMTMELMGIKLEELIDNIALGGVANYLQKAGESGINLFI